MEFDMHRPDTMIEIHRERVQDQTLEMFSGDKYTESVDGTGYSATATLDLTLDRVWFIVDSLDRLWQEETDGDSHDPLRHFAIDLVIFDSKIVIDSVTCTPLVPVPPATITIPDGPRAGESREIPYNEIPLFGRLTMHDQLERTKQSRASRRSHSSSLRRMLPCWWPPRCATRTPRGCSARTSSAVPEAILPSPDKTRRSAGNLTTPKAFG
jgi:hypothetical protein